MLPRRIAFPAALAGALVVQAALQYRFAVSHSATFDEPSYIAAGMSLWTTGVDDQMFIHPPLAKRVAGLAALLAGADPAGAPADRMGTGVLYRTNRDRAGRILVAARLATVAASLALTAVVALWARGWWGGAAGSLAAWLMAMEPNMLAHGALATTDLLFTLWVVLFARSLGAFLAAGGTPRAREWCGLFAGLALGTKFSALGFVPAVTAGIVAGAALAARSLAPARMALRSAPRMLLVAALVLFAAYSVQVRVFEPGWGRVGLLSWWPVTLSGLPHHYLSLGLRWTLDYMRTEAPVFFLGSIRGGTIPEYFPVTFALKVPLGLTLLAAVALALRLAARRLGSRELGIALAFAAIFAVVAPTWLHVGLRHILPAVVLAAMGAASLLDPALPLPRVRRAAAIAGLLWCAASAGRCAPHFLAHFNEVAGGPGGGWRHLADSNLDWGQDLPALARWCRDRNIKELPFYYFGTADPAWHGIGVSQLTPESPGWRGGLVAISVSYVDGTLTGDLGRFGWARTLTPVARPGWSIHVYELPPPPRPPRSRRARAGTGPGSR